MSAKRDPGEEEEDDFVPEDEDDDDEEDEFVPGAEDDDDAGGESDDDDDDDDDEIVPLLDGSLSMDDNQILHYEGEGFHIESLEPLKCNVLDPNTKFPTDMYTIDMKGHVDIVASSEGGTNGTTIVEGTAKKPTFRKLRVTWSVQDPPKQASSGGLKKGDEEEEEEEDDGKMPSVFYRVFGEQVAAAEGQSGPPPTSLLEFQGGYHPLSSKSSVGLVCQVRFVPVKSAATAAKPPAAAAAAAKRSQSDDDDDDDNDEGVGYDELIKLHEEAGLSVDTIRKRLRDGKTDGEEDENDQGKSTKKGKSMPDDDDDDDNIGF